MKITSYLTLANALLSLSAFASDDRQQILDQLEALQEQGFKQSVNYQHSDTDQLTQCTEASKPYRDEAKQLLEIIKKSNDVFFRMPAYQAADLAFQCVYCSEQAVNYCDKMNKYIVRTRKAIK